MLRPDRLRPKRIGVAAHRVEVGDTRLMEVRHVAADDWQVVRDLRLRALLDTPENFWAEHAEEVEKDEGWWRGLIEEEAWFVAYDGDRPVGITAGIRDDESPETRRQLIAMWVPAEDRRRGVAGLLIDAVAAWARDGGADVLELYVTSTNEAGFLVYEGAGFRRTGVTYPHRRDPALRFVQLTRRLSRDGT